MTGDREVNHAHGEASAYVDVAGYSLERGFDRIEWLLEKSRWRQCGFDSVEAFVESIKLKHFKPLIEQRQRIVAAIKREDAKVSNRKIGKALNVDPETVNRDVRAASAAPHPENTNENNYAKNETAANAAPTFGGEAAGKHANDVERGARELLEAGATQLLAQAFTDGRVSLADARNIAKDLSPEHQDMIAVLTAKDLIGNYQRWVRDERRARFFRPVITPDLPGGPWQVILADPPWRDEFGPNAKSTENFYPTMSTEDIMRIDVAGHAHEHAVLYLWALPHMFPEALEVMKAWGFLYRTHMVWGKDRVGKGQWCRNQHEDLLIGRRGAFPPPKEEDRTPSWVVEPVGKHSAKPVVFLESIERWYPEVAKIELFRRGEARPGWAAWGHEVLEAAP
jgi:N6-adenosine-specific RNA methylase IME4